MKTLTLSLKRQWFDMIKSGEKKEEYRRTHASESGMVAPNGVRNLVRTIS